MRLPIFQVDAFAAEPFRGSPAAVCPLERWVPDATLQAIAAENGASGTAFIVPSAGHYALRWFTPKVEADPCGHGTLAAAFVILTRLEPHRSSVSFETISGTLTTRTLDGVYEIDLPARAPSPCTMPAGFLAALGRQPLDLLCAAGYLAVYEDEAAVRNLEPDLATLARIDRNGVIVTAPGDGCDFVSRGFAPHAGIPEDPVTGSAHCTLVPYWAARLGKSRLHARQVSRRGGEFFCELRGDRVAVSGKAVLYLEGTIHV